MFSYMTKNFLSKLGTKFPIIQAPMAGGVTTPELIASVANSGGLGSLGAGYLSPSEIKSAIRAIRILTKYPFCVNLFAPQPINLSIDKIKKSNFILNAYRKELGIQPVDTTKEPSIKTELFEEQLSVIIEEGVPIVSFTFGLPSTDLMKKLKSNNVVIIGTATTVKEAVQLESSGCNMIVAQGSEAGGHRGTFSGPIRTSLIGTMALVPQIVDKVKIPVVAAGGIMDGRGLAAALTLGACGVQMGTAFLTCKESGISKKYKEAILNSNEESTIVTSVFSGRSARAIKNRFVEEMENHQDSLPDYPIQNSLTQDIRKEASKQNRTEFMSLWAGQGTRLSKEKSASEIIISVSEEAIKILSVDLRQKGPFPKL